MSITTNTAVCYSHVSRRRPLWRLEKHVKKNWNENSICMKKETCQCGGQVILKRLVFLLYIKCGNSNYLRTDVAVLVQQCLTKGIMDQTLEILSRPITACKRKQKQQSWNRKDHEVKYRGQFWNHEYAFGCIMLKGLKYLQLNTAPLANCKTITIIIKKNQIN